MTPDTIEAMLHRLCAAAGAQTLSRFRKNGTVENKLESGFDPVTAADKATERVIRNLISQEFPDHGILGEEEADHNSEADYCWVIDPIDGTRAYISGLPSWGTLIGLTHQGTPIAGVMQQPHTDEHYMAVPGRAFLAKAGTESGLATSNVTSLEEATLMTTDPFLFEGTEWTIFNSLKDACRLTRYGFDCYAYAMVAAGNIDLVIESGLNTFDIAPLIPIINEAGGLVTTWDGKDASQGGRVIAAANETVHAAAIDLIKKSA